MGIGRSPCFRQGPDFISASKDREKKMNFSALEPAQDKIQQELNSRLESIFTGSQVSMIPGDEASIEAAKPPEKTRTFRGKGIIIFAMMCLVTGIAVKADWSWVHSLTENLKSYERGVVETISVITSKAQPAAQAAPVAATVTSPDVSEILNRLNAIDRGLSSMQQSVTELAAGQAQLRKAQLDLAVVQSRLVALQTVASAKENKISAPDAITGRRFYRRDYR
jgi:hypothetical protein